MSNRLFKTIVAVADRQNCIAAVEAVCVTHAAVIQQTQSVSAVLRNPFSTPVDARNNSHPRRMKLSHSA